MIEFIAGAMVGACVGVLAMALAAIASRNERELE